MKLKKLLAILAISAIIGCTSSDNKIEKITTEIQKTNNKINNIEDKINNIDSKIKEVKNIIETNINNNALDIKK